MSNQTQRQQKQAPFTRTEEVKAVAQQPIAEPSVETPAVATLSKDDVSTDPPVYEFAGASMGNDGVYDCGQCGSLVRGASQDAHTYWHGVVNALLVQAVQA